MDGKNKEIATEIPSASARSKNSTAAGPFSSMSPSNLPLAPRSFNARKKPYFMNQVGAGGASSSGTKTHFFQGTSDPLSMEGENNKTDQNPFPPSDQNQTLETSDGDNSVKTDAGKVQVRGGSNLDPNMDPKKLRRIISNRLSAQKSRIKKLQHVCDMERKAESLETLVAVLSSQVALQKDKKYMLQMEQKNLNQRLAACANHKIMIDAEIEERKAELNRLRQLYLTQQQQQQRQQMQAQTMAIVEHGLPQQMVNPCLNQSGIGQSMYVNSNQAAVDVGEYGSEMNRLNQLNLQQENPGHNLVPGWEPGRGQLTNVGLDQSGLGHVQNPCPNQSKEQETGSFTSSMGELEQILKSFSPENHITPRNDFA